MIENFSQKIIEKMVSKQMIDEGYEEDYVYAFICILEAGLSIGTILILSLLLNDFIPTVVFLVTFLALRRRSGGYHFDSFWKCYLATITIYIFCSFICQQRMYSVIVYGFTFVAVLEIALIGAVNHPNMNMREDEYIGTKRMTRVVLVLEVSVLIALVYLNVSEIIIQHMAMGIVLCAILLLISKIFKQEVTKNE